MMVLILIGDPLYEPSCPGSKVNFLSHTYALNICFHLFKNQSNSYNLEFSSN